MLKTPLSLRTKNLQKKNTDQHLRKIITHLTTITIDLAMGSIGIMGQRLDKAYKRT